jgi:hypothetical protein
VNGQHVRLLIELLSLRQRYGADVFGECIAELKSGKLASAMESSLASLAETNASKELDIIWDLISVVRKARQPGGKSGSVRKQRNVPRSQNLLTTLPELELDEDSKKILGILKEQSIAQLRRSAVAVGLDGDFGAIKKSALISRILAKFSSLAPEARSAAIRDVERTSGGSSSLDDWAKLIVKD